MNINWNFCFIMDFFRYAQINFPILHHAILHKYLRVEWEACWSLLPKKTKKSWTINKHARLVNTWHMRKYQHRRVDSSALRSTVFVRETYYYEKISFIWEMNVNSWQKKNKRCSSTVMPSHTGQFPKQTLHVGNAHDLSWTHPDHHLTFSLDTLMYPLKPSLGKFMAIFSLI